MVGHRIPVITALMKRARTSCELIVSEEKPKKCLAAAIRYYTDNDVLDTWFSSALWPFRYSLGRKPDNEELKYYYPTAFLPQVMKSLLMGARMVQMGLEFLNESF
jgi:valyl-tRNA synthetase